EKQTCELHLLRTGGAPFIARLEMVVEHAGSEPATRCLLVMSDITAHIRAEEAVQQSEERFRALTQASSDIIYRMSADWSLMVQLDGRNFIADTDEPRSSWLQTYIHPDDQPQV